MKNSKLKICCLSALMLLGGCESSKHCKKCEGCEKCKANNALRQENKNDTNNEIARSSCVNASFGKNIE